MLAKGDQSGSSRLVAAQGEVLYSIDDTKRIFRAQGDKVEEVTPDDAEKWKTVDAFQVFLSNLYVLDATSGQVWKHESRDGVNFGIAQSYLTDLLPAGTARSLAIDADIWLVTTSGEILRYRRLTTSFTATRVDFQAKWTGAAAKPVASALEHLLVPPAHGFQG